MMEIESGVPLPDEHVSKYPFHDMLPGDSIFFAKKDKNLASSARTCAWRFVKTQEPEWEFTLRRTDPMKDKEGYRLWRVK